MMTHSTEPEDDQNDPPKAGDTGDEPNRAKSVAVKESTGVSVQPALLEEAVAQLRKLSELRQLELNRQEKAITDMRETAARQARQNRMMFNMSGALICILSLLVAFSVQALKSEQEDTSQEVRSMATRMGTTTSMIRQVAKKQAAETDALKVGLTGSFSAAATEMSGKLDSSVGSMSSKLDATAEEVARNVDKNISGLNDKLSATSSDISAKLDTSVDSMRKERDVVQQEVKKALDAHRDHIVEREVALNNQALEVEAQAEKTRKERMKIIGDAITRLSTMADSLKTPEERDAEKKLAEEKKAIEEKKAAADKKAADDKKAKGGEEDKDPEKQALKKGDEPPPDSKDKAPEESADAVPQETKADAEKAAPVPAKVD